MNTETTNTTQSHPDHQEEENRERDRDGPIRFSEPKTETATESQKECPWCKTSLIDITDDDDTEYYICTKCNPDEEISYKRKGCYGSCSFCRYVVYMNNNTHCSCGNCRALMCNFCACQSPRIWIEKEYKDEDEEENEETKQMLFCNQQCKKDYDFNH